MCRLLPAFLFACVAAATFVAAGPAAAQSRPAAPAAKSVPAPKPQLPDKAKRGAESNPERRAECAWTGQRIISLLWRDDVNTAREQTRFYEMFGCPAAHLPVAFRCVIEQSESQPEQNDLTARVYACWMAPEAREIQE